MRAGNLFVLCWDVVDYYGRKANADEYFVYLQHNVQLMKWLEDRISLGKLEKAIVESTGDSSLRSDLPSSRAKE